MSELSKQSSDALEMFSEYLTNLAAPSTNWDTVQSKKLQQMLGRRPKMLVNTIFGLALTCMRSFRVWCVSLPWKLLLHP